MHLARVFEAKILLERISKVERLPAPFPRDLEGPNTNSVTENNVLGVYRAELAPCKTALQQPISTSLKQREKLEATKATIETEFNKREV